MGGNLALAHRADQYIWPRNTTVGVVLQTLFAGVIAFESDSG